MLHDGLVRQGRWLFRRRGWLPVLLLPMFALALDDFERIEVHFGEPVQEAWEILSVAVAFIGLALRALIVGYVPAGTSGRNARQQRADALNTTGMYSMVRHPLYVANYVGVLGILLYAQSIWLAVVISMIYWLHYERIIMAEEAFLSEKYGERYRTWADATPALIPRFKFFSAPDLTFSWKSVLRREYPSLLSTVIAFAFVDIVGHWRSDGVFEMKREWLMAVAICALIALILRTLKKSGYLNVIGR